MIYFTFVWSISFIKYVSVLTYLIIQVIIHDDKWFLHEMTLRAHEMTNTMYAWNDKWKLVTLIYLENLISKLLLIL